MTKVERIEKLLETERQKIARLEREVNVDPPLAEALIRRTAYQNCLKILNSE